MLPLSTIDASTICDKFCLDRRPNSNLMISNAESLILDKRHMQDLDLSANATFAVERVEIELTSQAFNQQELAWQ